MTAAKEETASAPIPILPQTRVRGVAPENTPAIGLPPSVTSTLRWGSWQIYDRTPVGRLVGLDYFGARYYSGAQGRFTSPDVPLADQWEKDPQSWNLYSYVRNNPLRFTDPTGRACVVGPNGDYDDDSGGQSCADVAKDNANLRPSSTTTAQGGNVATAFALNALFALSNTANNYFAWMFEQRPNVLQNTPTNREFTGQVAAGAVFVGTMMIGPGGAKVPLTLIHSPATLSKTILDGLRKKSTQELIESLKPGLEEALRVKPDGRVMNGNHRITVLMERGVDVNALPREIMK